MSISISPYRSQRLRRVQELIGQLQPEAPPDALIIPGSPRPRGSVIVFPGSFNPPTIAHLALLKQADKYARQQASHEPMLLYAAFSKHTIDKETVERPFLRERILLLEEVLHKRLPHAGIMLFNRGLYVEQAQGLRHAFPRVRRILFLMGYDKVVQIFDPHYYKDRDAALEELFALAELLVAPRGTAREDDIATLLQQPQNQRFASFVHVLPFDPRYRAISSTEIRQHGALHQQDVPQEVRRFMRETRAYASA